MVCHMVRNSEEKSGAGAGQARITEAVLGASEPSLPSKVLALLPSQLRVS